MPFLFGVVCQLLDRLERLKLRNPPFAGAKFQEEERHLVEYWFKCHRRLIDSRDTDQVALLSTLFPERRTDRVYGLQESKLSKVIARCLHLNTVQTAILLNWNTPGAGDLETCVEKVLRPFDSVPKPVHSRSKTGVTVEEVDAALQELASRCRFSAPNIRSSLPPALQSDILENLYQRLQSSQAKWLTRLILKDFSPVIVDSSLVLREFHFLLPGLLQFQDSFSAAVTVLREELSKYHAKPDPNSQRIFKREAAKLLRPKVGVKVGRPPFLKARSMNNCVQMLGNQRWSIERKYDGEYCEIHVDLEKGNDCIKIFSKSGKDSTNDRKDVHGAIRRCLQIGRPSCVFKKKCIVIGELVVWSDREQKILGFHKIRKYVSRSGTFIGTDGDSQRHPWEHLMIVFFDVLLVDNDMIMRKPHVERRKCLSQLVRKITGLAMTAEWKVLDFASQKESSNKALCSQFAAAVSSRTEGLVLKPSDMPYFAFDRDETSERRGYFIKLKKDYMQELGGERDVADFAVIGASFDPKQAAKSGLRNLKFTTFHLGCLKNENSLRFDSHTPLFEIVDVITQEQCIPNPVLQLLNDYGRFQSEPFERVGDRLGNPEHIGFDLCLDKTNNSKMDVVFKDPFVVEVLGSGFEKPSNKQYFTLRHPRILKLHMDRTWKDAITMQGLEDMADEARNGPEEGESQELSQLTKKLMGKFERKKASQQRHAVSTSQSETTASSGSAGRSASSSTQSPSLVRIDSSELLRGNIPGGNLVEQAHSEYSTSAQESLPTPPSSREHVLADNSSRSSAGKGAKGGPNTLKRILENESKFPAALKRARTEDDVLLAPKALTNISSNLTRSRSLDVYSKVSSITNKSTNSCNNPYCLFSRAVAYLSPCIRDYAWVRDSLLKWHATERTTHLLHWRRETTSMSALGPIVSESPAWPGLQKIIFVEKNHVEASMACVSEVRRLKIREDILWFDWRVLEDMKGIEERQVGFAAGGFGKDIFKRHYFGITKWDNEMDDSNFVGREVLHIPLEWME